MGMERSRGAAAFVIVVVVFAAMFAESWIPASAQTTEVNPTVETEPVPSSGDAADDPAIWVHPSDPSLSVVIGTDKEGGLAVYDLSGTQLQYLAGFRPNNVDLHHGFPLGGQRVDLVVTSDRDDDAVTLHRVDPQSRQLVTASPPIDAGIDVLGVCLYHSPGSGDLYVFVTSDGAGPIRQWRLADDGAGQVTATQVREIDMASTAEGCVVDDDLGNLFVAEEAVGIWKYGAEPDAGSSRVAVDRVGSELDSDVEGLTIYYGQDDAGYLIASSQGAGEYVVYERAGDNAHVTNFQIVDSGSIDGTSSTDGIDVISTPLGAGFPNGVFVAQDGDNDSGNQNFKLVPWELVAESANPSLIVETGRGPRAGGTGSPPPAAAPSTTLPPVEPDDGVTWTTAQAAVVSADDDGELGDDGSIAAGSALVMQAGSRVALRFSGLEVPPGAVLRSAHVQFTASDQGDTGVVLSIRGLADDSQAETGAVTWAPAAWETGDAGAYQQTPDLSRVIEQVIAGGWESGSAMTLVISGEGQGQRSALSFDEGSETAPRLTLQYTLDY